MFKNYWLRRRRGWLGKETRVGVGSRRWFVSGGVLEACGILVPTGGGIKVTGRQYRRGVDPSEDATMPTVVIDAATRDKLLAAGDW
ncbi:MAG: hypothetical protein JWO38_7750 [Gemmataceae bacterium]|nr:hypothetical protein [Gemmataceae bacterium]